MKGQREGLNVKYQKTNIFRTMSLFLILLFLGLMSASVTHAENYKLVKQWGSYGSGDGQFSTSPVGIGVDSSGNVYVAESGNNLIGNNRIQKFDSNGTFISKWGSWGSDDGQFNNPYDVAVDSSGNVYVAECNNERIQKFDSNGNFITKWGSSEGSNNGQFNSPTSIAVDSSGHVYVADSWNHRIQKFDSNGGYITQWGSYGNGSGQFYFPEAVAVDSSGYVYVADLRNYRIQKFDSNGGYITQWGSYGSGNGQFKALLGVAVDSSGNVYVADSYNYRIQKFDSNGGYITQWGSYGSGNGQFNIPHDVAVDSSGNVYVSDFYNRYIQKFAPPLSVANFTSNASGGNVPLSVQFTDLSQNATGWNWSFGDNTYSTVQNPAHTYTEAGTYTVNLSVSNPSGWDNITKTGYIIVNSSNTPVDNLDEVPYAYITSYNNYPDNYGTVTVINTATNKVTATVPVGSAPNGIAVTPDRTKVYVANTDSDTVSVIDTATNTVISTVDVGSVPSGVAINPDGTKVYITNYYSNTASVIDTYTNTVTATVDIGDCPNGIAVKSDGKKIYVANGVPYPTNRGIVSVIDSTTNTVTATVDIGSYPSDIAVTPDGKYVYVTESSNNTVSVIDTSTNTVTAIVNVREAPIGVAVSPDGKYVYVANSDRGIVSVIDASTNTVIDSVSVGGGIPVDIAITSDGKKVYVTNFDSQKVYVIDTSTNTVTATVSVGLLLNNIAISQFPESPQTALPVANFTSNVTEGNAPLSVQFTDLSENATEWSWDFDNDGIIDSTKQSPSYTYSSAGNYSVNLTVSNADGNDSEVKTDYIVVSTPETLDTTAPVIQSVVLFPANITAGSSINISVNVTDDTDVTEVKVGGIIQLTKTDGIWQGIIETPSSNSVGNYPLQITANDAAGNIAETSVPYHVVKLTGGANIGVSPRSNSIKAGNTASLSIKVKNTQNIDDTFKVRINVSEVPVSYRADLSWFNWTEKVVTLRAGEEVLIPIEVTVPGGTAAGRKLFRAKVNSVTSSITGFDTGYLVIS